MRIVAFLTFCFALGFAPPPKGEVEWSAVIAKEIGGEAEVRTPDGSRCDILTDEYAYEVEWCKSGKIFEAIGQSRFYGLALNRKPGIILLMRGGPNEARYYLRCLAVANSADPRIRVETRRVN